MGGWRMIEERYNKHRSRERNTQEGSSKGHRELSGRGWELKPMGMAMKIVEGMVVGRTDNTQNEQHENKRTQQRAHFPLRYSFSFHSKRKKFYFSIQIH
jgi:hypothetical protein